MHSSPVSFGLSWITRSYIPWFNSADPDDGGAAPWAWAPAIRIHPFPLLFLHDFLQHPLVRQLDVRCQVCCAHESRVAAVKRVCHFINFSRLGIVKIMIPKKRNQFFNFRIWIISNITHPGSRQGNGLMPVWIISWEIRRRFIRNFLPHVEHSNLRSPLHFISHNSLPWLVLKYLPQTQLEIKEFFV